MIPKIVMTVFTMALCTLGLIALIDSMAWQYKIYKKIRPQDYVIATAILSFGVLSVWAIWWYINI